MTDPQQLDREIRDYLEKEPNLRREDRLNYLKVLFDKHFQLNKLDHMVTSRDLFSIISNAKGNYSRVIAPVFISGRKADATDLPNIAVIEAFVSYLNSMDLLRKTVKVDYRD